MSEDAALAIVGIYPPPYGGVSVSLQRLIPYLDASGLDYVVYNTGRSKTQHPRIKDTGWSLRWALRMLLRSRHRVIQFSTARWPVRVFAGFINMLRGTKVILYARGYGLVNTYTQGGRVKRALVKWSLRRAARVLAPNPALRERIAEIGYDRDRIAVVPPFVPPMEQPQAADLPEPVRQFCAEHQPLLVANGAYTLVNGQDTYGLRAMLQLMRELLPAFPRLGLVVYLRQDAVEQRTDFADVVAQLKEAPFAQHALFYESRGEFLPIYAVADVFLRLTTTDGDANSIREALHFGIPVVASDVIPRPAGCRLYPFGQHDELVRVVGDVLANLPRERSLAAAAPRSSAADLLIPIYRELIGAPSGAAADAAHLGAPSREVAAP